MRNAECEMRECEMGDAEWGMRLWDKAVGKGASGSQSYLQNAV